MNRERAREREREGRRSGGREIRGRSKRMITSL